MAAQARNVLLSERKRTMTLLKSTEYGRQMLSEMPKLKPESLNDIDLDSPDALLQINERALRQLANTLFDVLPDLDRDLIETVTVDSDTTSASTRSFPDGSHLIMVSDAMMTLVDLLGALLSAWSHSKGRSRITSAIRRSFQARKIAEAADADPMVHAGAAALRYYILHQRVWASSAKVSTRTDARTSMKDPERGFGVLALVYVLAHELGHIARGHTRQSQPADADTQRAHELEADDFAFPICARAWGGGKHIMNVTAIAATIAHSAIAISTEPLFVRSPETHPGFQERLQRVATHYPNEMQNAVNGYWGLIEMVERGMATGKPLPEHYWTAMVEQPELDTRQHSAAYFTMIRGFDMTIGYSTRRAWRFIEGMTEPDAPHNVRDQIAKADLTAIARSLECVDHNDVAGAMNALGVTNAAALLDCGTPLSYHQLVETILESEAMGCGHCKPDRKPRMAAFVLAHLAAPLLTKTAGSHVV